jgi:hypothetical protein
LIDNAGVPGTDIQNTNGVKLSSSLVGVNPEQAFQFVNRAGASVSYTDFNQFRLYDENTQDFIAYADM